MIFQESVRSASGYAWHSASPLHRRNECIQQIKVRNEFSQEVCVTPPTPIPPPSPPAPCLPHHIWPITVFSRSMNWSLVGCCSINIFVILSHRPVKALALPPPPPHSTPPPPPTPPHDHDLQIEIQLRGSIFHPLLSLHTPAYRPLGFLSIWWIYCDTVLTGSKCPNRYFPHQ